MKLCKQMSILNWNLYDTAPYTWASRKCQLTDTKTYRNVQSQIPVKVYCTVSIFSISFESLTPFGQAGCLDKEHIVTVWLRLQPTFIWHPVV